MGESMAATADGMHVLVHGMTYSCFGNTALTSMPCVPVARQAEEIYDYIMQRCHLACGQENDSFESHT